MMMKKVCVFLGVLLLLGAATAASGSIVEGKKFEFSTALSFETFSYTYPDAPAGYKYTQSYLNIPIRFGWFIWKGLELEPELMWTSYHYHEVYPGYYDDKYHETGVLFSANVLYNFKLKSPHWVPFVLAGFGFGNGVPYEGYVEKWDTGSKVSTPNLGVGVKYLFGNIGALRLEYRYRHYRISTPYEDDAYIEHVTFNTIFVGLSLFF